MYLQYWRLKEKPFENTPDPKFLYHSPQHEEGLSRLIYVVREGKGAGMLTGIYGCGKTLLGHALASELEKDVYRVAFLTNPRLDDIEMLRMIVYLLGMPKKLLYAKPTCSWRSADFRRQYARRQKDRHCRGTHAIEQASIFEEIRLLLNFQSHSQFLLTLLILGQPELKNKVEANKQLNQRIAMRYHLQGLTMDETAHYVHHRLLIAGTKAPLFDEESLVLIHERSGGIPRRINQICDISLLNGMTHQSQIVNADMVREAITSLEG